MKITRFHLFSFRLPLKQPLPVAGQKLTTRRGCIIALEDEKAHMGMGEASPLPSLNRETPEETKSQLVSLGNAVLGREVPAHLETLSGGFHAWLGAYHLAPSVRFGFETAVLNLLASRLDTTLCRLICKTPKDAVSISGLLAGSQEEMVQKAEALIRKGYKTLKLKVGRGALSEDVTTVTTLRALMGDRGRIRLDANRAWDLRQARSLAQEVGDGAIDYVEEPVKTLEMLKTLARDPAFRLPLAVDETLAEGKPEDLPALSGLAAVVIKPTRYGFERSVRLARAATKQGMMPVFSAAFESGLGVATLAHMAAAVDGRDIPAGLDTLGWFREDVLAQPLEIKDGRLSVTQRPFSVTHLRKDLIAAISHG